MADSLVGSRLSSNAAWASLRFGIGSTTSSAVDIVNAKLRTKKSVVSFSFGCLLPPATFDCCNMSDSTAMLAEATALVKIEPSKAESLYKQILDQAARRSSPCTPPRVLTPQQSRRTLPSSRTRNQPSSPSRSSTATKSTLSLANSLFSRLSQRCRNPTALAQVVRSSRSLMEHLPKAKTAKLSQFIPRTQLSIARLFRLVHQLVHSSTYSKRFLERARRRSN